MFCNVGKNVGEPNVIWVASCTDLVLLSFEALVDSILIFPSQYISKKEDPLHLIAITRRCFFFGRLSIDSTYHYWHFRSSVVGAHLKEIELEVKKFLFLSDLIVCSYFHFFASVEVVVVASCWKAAHLGAKTKLWYWGLKKNFKLKALLPSHLLHCVSSFFTACIYKYKY